VIAARILAVVAALFFVTAFSLALMLPPELSLGQAIAALSDAGLAAVQDAVRRPVPDWIWLNLALPLLQRPAWVLPATIALVTAGISASLTFRQASARSHHRRS
jgi:hypothetical protein